MHCVAESEPGNLRLQGISVRPRAENPYVEIEPAGPQRSSHVDETVMPLNLHETPHTNDSKPATCGSILSRRKDYSVGINRITQYMSRN